MPTDANEKRRIYFAYGSNLSRRQMNERCPRNEAVARHDLQGWELAFVGKRTQRWGRGGVATIFPAGGIVRGALYSITAEHEAVLDGFEGVDDLDPEAGHYYRHYFEIEGCSSPVMCYIATARRGSINMPNRRYLDVILEGFRDWGIDSAGLDALDCYAAGEP